MSEFSKRNDEINERIWEALVEQYVQYATLVNGTLWLGFAAGFAIKIAAKFYG